MDTLKVGMRDEMVWEVTEDLATSRGDYKVFSTPGMTRFVEMTAHKLVGPHLKPGQGQVGLQRQMIVHPDAAPGILGDTGEVGAPDQGPGVHQLAWGRRGYRECGEKKEGGWARDHPQLVC